MLETALLLSVMIERVVEWVFGTPFDKVKKLTPYKWTLMYVAGLVGVGVALTFNIDLLTLLDLPTSVLGEVLSGIIIGGGSSLIHDIFSRE